jgi:nucleoporin SEH1
MATCSIDRTIRVWDLHEERDNQWVLSSEIIEAHSAPINRISWSHPEFGQVLASCSSDMNVNIFEEIVDRVSGDRKWIKRASLVDSKNEVTDVQFSPKHLGLCLATCSRDGMIRIYEAFDVMKLSMWPMQVGSF